MGEWACDLDTSVPEWVIDYPETLALFQELGMDCSCGGKSLAYVCHARGLEPVTILARLHQLLNRTVAAPSVPTVLASIQVGMPREYGTDHADKPMERSWTTAFDKQPVRGAIRLDRTNLDGDRQADLVHHGGPDKAVLAYAASHYPAWREELNNPTLPYGGFGENFTVDGLTEAEVCIGDIWKIGDQAVVQVSQPRQPCWKLARHWGIKTLALQVQEKGRTGWYFRVLSEGMVEAGMPVTLQERPAPEWTVARANHLMHQNKDDVTSAAELAAIPMLSASWKETLTKRVEHRPAADVAKRLVGPNDG